VLLFVSPQFSWLLYISSAASMLIGALGAIRVMNSRGDIRAFIAYTSINQAGFVLLGLVCMNGEGLVSSFVYLIVYLLASLLFIGVLSRTRFVDTNGERSISRLGELSLLYESEQKFSRRFDLFVLAYAVWSMAGLPPLAGFFGKVGL
jgi:NADH-quinone oxidoreductase subunit N